jgi:UDP-N-acetylmuramoyl-tripeptide--D-alanyl-D-alanine ligase
MLELGTESDAAHREIGRALADSGVDVAVLVGDAMRAAAEVLDREWGPERITWLPDVDGPRAREVARLLHAGDIVLLKGSRRVGLERVAAALEGGRSSKLKAQSSDQNQSPAPTRARTNL